MKMFQHLRFQLKCREGWGWGWGLAGWIGWVGTLGLGFGYWI